MYPGECYPGERVVGFMEERARVCSSRIGVVLAQAVSTRSREGVSNLDRELGRGFLGPGKAVSGVGSGLSSDGGISVFYTLVICLDGISRISCLVISLVFHLYYRLVLD